MEEIKIRVAKLTPREREVLGHIVRGRSNKEIGWYLGISLSTVKAHRAKVMEKMQATSIADLVRMYIHGNIG